MSEAEALRQARAAALRGEGFAALDLLRQAITGPEQFGAEWAAVVRLCAKLDDDDAALLAAQRLWRETPRTVATAFILARSLEATGRVAEAVALLEPAARAGQLGAMELQHLSRMLMFVGRLESALTLVRRLLEDDPGNFFLWERIAQLKRFTPGDPDIDALSRLQDHLGTAAPRLRASAEWALAKAFVDIGDDSGAARMLDRAAASRREVTMFDLASIEHSARASLAVLPPTELAAIGHSDESSRVIFILGPQRSGTTLVEQILGRHPSIRGGGELKFLWLTRHALGDFTQAPIAAYLERMRREAPDIDPWAAIRRRYFALADERFGAGASFTDKLLSNHLRLAVIRHAFPGARIIRCRRDPLDTAWSCWRARFGEESAWNASPFWIARHIAVYESLLDSWAERFPDWFITVSYEQLVANPEMQIPALLQACGLPDHGATRRPHESTRAVSSSSFAQVREPIHASRVGAAQAFPIATRALRTALEAEGLTVGAQEA